MILFNVAESISDRLFHGFSLIIGICIIQHYAQECLFLLVLFVILSYITLHIPKKYYKDIGVFLPSLFIIAHWYILFLLLRLD